MRSVRYQDIEQVRIKGLPGFDRPFYEVRTSGGVILEDATTGEPISPLEIQSRPLPLWRWFDALWMLHTMDYRGRYDFSNPLVILVSTGALWLGISGGLLLFQAFGPSRGLDPGPRSGAWTWSHIGSACAPHAGSTENLRSCPRGRSLIS